MILLTCPNCGDRNVAEFRFGGGVRPRPPDPGAISDAEWTEYLYYRENPAGTQREWWLHGSGCGLWFQAIRDTRSNQVERTERWASPVAPGAGSHVG
jgi:sarcosine oxidase subunit delta